MLSFLVSNSSSLHTFVNQFLILFSPGYIMLLDTGGGGGSYDGPLPL